MSFSPKTIFEFCKRFANAPQLFWLLLFLPSLPLLADFRKTERYYAEIMYESGILAVQLTVFALALTPLLYLTKGWNAGQTIVRWFIKRRRHIGVAAFGYSALHTAFYIRYIGSFELILLDLVEPELLIGWVAILVMLALAATSNNLSQRVLGKHWKTLQRSVYLAAAATALHWVLINQFLDDLAIWALPLLGLQAFRVMRQRIGSKRSSERHDAKA